jgi:hypothetical protein
MNKKILFVFALMILSIGIASAQSIIVEKVEGVAQVAVSGGGWRALEAGAVLESADIIVTKLNSYLILTVGSESVTIGAGHRGTLTRLLVGKLKTDVKLAADEKAKEPASRASEAVADTEWVD